MLLATRSPYLLPLSLAFPLSCGGAALPPKTAPAPPPVEAAVAIPEAPPPAKPALPTACSNPADADHCTPPGPFVDALCNGSFPDATLALFARGSPWTRAYLTGDADSWYASGGGSLRARLAFDEEVLLLRVRAPSSGGVVVGNGSASYDVLRWDGLCYTLEAGELTAKRPPRAKSPALAFHHFSDATQSMLLRDDAVLTAHKKRGRECHGVTSGDVTLACEKADRALGEAVVAYVRAGGALPEPARIPGF